MRCPSIHLPDEDLVPSRALLKFIGFLDVHTSVGIRASARWQEDDVIEELACGFASGAQRELSVGEAKHGRGRVRGSSRLKHAGTWEP